MKMKEYIIKQEKSNEKLFKEEPDKGCQADFLERILSISRHAKMKNGGEVLLWRKLNNLHFLC